MILLVRDIPDGRSTLRQNVTIPEELSEAGGFAAVVACTAIVDRISQQILLRISYSCSVSLVCSRCLKQFDQRISGEFPVVLIETESKKKAALSNEENDEDENGIYFSDTDAEVDVRHLLYEEIMINMPIQPLCAEDCAGICSSAIKSDADPHDTTDPRWDALKKLKR